MSITNVLTDGEKSGSDMTKSILIGDPRVVVGAVGLKEMVAAFAVLANNAKEAMISIKNRIFFSLYSL